VARREERAGASRGERHFFEALLEREEKSRRRGVTVDGRRTWAAERCRPTGTCSQFGRCIMVILSIRNMSPVCIRHRAYGLRLREGGQVSIDIRNDTMSTTSFAGTVCSCRRRPMVRWRKDHRWCRTVARDVTRSPPSPRGRTRKTPAYAAKARRIAIGCEQMMIPVPAATRHLIGDCRLPFRDIRIEQWIRGNRNTGFWTCPIAKECASALCPARETRRLCPPLRRFGLRKERLSARSQTFR
jgi:hypothetical protein